MLRCSVLVFGALCPVCSIFCLGAFRCAAAVYICRGFLGCDAPLPSPAVFMPPCHFLCSPSPSPSPSPALSPSPSPSPPLSPCPTPSHSCSGFVKLSNILRFTHENCEQYGSRIATKSFKDGVSSDLFVTYLVLRIASGELRVRAMRE